MLRVLVAINGAQVLSASLRASLLNERGISLNLAEPTRVLRAVVPTITGATVVAVSAALHCSTDSVGVAI